MTLPTRKELGGRMLNVKYKSMKEIMDSQLNQGYYTLLTDGWTNIKREPIINYCMSSTDGASYFIESVSTGSNGHNAAYLSGDIQRILDSYPQIAGICTDNAPANKAAWKNIQRLSRKFRNRLSAQKVMKLSFVKSNFKLLQEDLESIYDSEMIKAIIKLKMMTMMMMILECLMRYLIKG